MGSRQHTPYLYGMTDLCPEHILNGQGVLVHPVALGHNPDDYGSVNYSNRQETVICRLQHGWDGEGTLPVESLMPQYLQRIRNFVLGSEGVRIWIVWNEPNHSQERPHGRVITPGYAASSYLGIRDVIRSQPGHENDLVLVGAIAPWNLETGDWLQYQLHTLSIIGENADGITFHAYTHGSDPRLIYDDEKRHGWYWHFWTYRQQVYEGVPQALLDRPFYITETNQGDGAWRDINSGWVQNAYAEIDEWNSQGNPKIRSLVLYRWAFDQWEIQDKPGVQGDLHAAMEHQYTWTENEPEPPEEIMLQNPGLELPYTRRGADEVEIADKWNFGFNQVDNPSTKRPECKPETRDVGEGRVFEGETAQKIFWTFGVGQAWISQTVGGLVPGTWYELIAHVYVWSSDFDNADESRDTGKMWIRLGANPWGDENANGLATEYGGAVVDQYDHWVELSIVFQAKSDRSSVFLWGSPEHAVKHNDLYWDAVSLAEWECQGGTEPEPPDPEPGECKALTYDQTVEAAEQGVKNVLATVCTTFGL